MTVLSDFQTRFPELADDIESNQHILNVWSTYDASTYQASTQEKILNLIAHLLVVDMAGSGQVAQTQSQTVGRVSASYAVQAAKNDADQFFRATKYGQQYLILLSYGPRAYAV